MAAFDAAQITLKKGNAALPQTDSCVPSYMHDVYDWAYLNPRNVKFLDRELIVSLILWGNNGRLKQALLDEISPSAMVLQAAHVYGSIIPEIAAKLCHPKQLEVIEVSPLQAGICQKKLHSYPDARVRLGDVATLNTQPVDLVSCFFLLHEIPSDYKWAVVNTLLAHVNAGGQAVFIDYHRPHKLHPLKSLMRVIFNLLEPFAEELWDQEISAYAKNSKDFIWRKETFFGGLYQKTVAQRKR